MAEYTVKTVRVDGIHANLEMMNSTDFREKVGGEKPISTQALDYLIKKDKIDIVRFSSVRIMILMTDKTKDYSARSDSRVGRTDGEEEE